MKLCYNRWIVCCSLVALSSMFGDSDAATYVVGDSLGWMVPPNPSAYATWASQHVFRTGDVLVFNYTTGFHDVARVTKQAYDSCASSNPIALATVGPTSFTLNSTGPDHYICTFGQHCSLGQKLEINVMTSSASPSPSPSTSPAPTPTPQPPSTVSPGPAPSGTMMPPPFAPGSEPALGPPPSDLIPANPLAPPPNPLAPPPNSAVAVGSPVVALACVVFGLLVTL